MNANTVNSKVKVHLWLSDAAARRHAVSTRQTVQRECCVEVFMRDLPEKIVQLITNYRGVVLTSIAGHSARTMNGRAFVADSPGRTIVVDELPITTKDLIAILYDEIDAASRRGEEFVSP